MTRRVWLLALLPVLLLSGCATQESQQAASEPDAATASYALCAPIPEDQMDTWKSMMDEVKAKKDMHMAANSSVGVSREMVWLQETPEGAAAVVYFEGSDLEDLLARRASAEDEHSQWFVSQITNIHGLPEDLATMPANEMIMMGDISGVEGETQSFALAVPILPGKEEAHAAFIAEIKGERNAAWEESRRSRGIAKEYVWNQTAPDGSIFTVVYFEITDPANLNSPAHGEFETWFRDQLADIHGIPTDAPMPANSLVASF